MKLKKFAKSILAGALAATAFGASTVQSGGFDFKLNHRGLAAPCDAPVVFGEPVIYGISKEGPFPSYGHEFDDGGTPDPADDDDDTYNELSLVKVYGNNFSNDIAAVMNLSAFPDAWVGTYTECVNSKVINVLVPKSEGYLEWGIVLWSIAKYFETYSREQSIVAQINDSIHFLPDPIITGYSSTTVPMTGGDVEMYGANFTSDMKFYLKYDEAYEAPITVHSSTNATVHLGPYSGPSPSGPAYLRGDYNWNFEQATSPTITFQ